MTVLFLVQQEAADGKKVHLGAQEAVDCLGRCLHDRLIFIERGVQKDGHAGFFFEAANQLPIQPVHVSLNGLESAGSITMRHGRNSVSLLRLYLICHDHEGGWVVGLEVFAHLLRKNGWTEWSEWLAILDAAVQNGFHVWTARIREDASVPQSTRAKFHAALKPADDSSLYNFFDSASDQVIFRELMVLASCVF